MSNRKKMFARNLFMKFAEKVRCESLHMDETEASSNDSLELEMVLN